MHLRGLLDSGSGKIVFDIHYLGIYFPMFRTPYQQLFLILTLIGCRLLERALLLAGQDRHQNGVKASSRAHKLETATG